MVPYFKLYPTIQSRKGWASIFPAHNWEAQQGPPVPRGCRDKSLLSQPLTPPLYPTSLVTVTLGHRLFGGGRAPRGSQPNLQHIQRLHTDRRTGPPEGTVTQAAPRALGHESSSTQLQDVPVWNLLPLRAWGFRVLVPDSPRN